MICHTSLFKNRQFNIRASALTAAILTSVLFSLTACQKTEVAVTQADVSDNGSDAELVNKTSQVDMPAKPDEGKTPEASSTDATATTHSAATNDAVSNTNDNTSLIPKNELQQDDAHNATIHNSNAENKPSLSDIQVTDVQYQNDQGQVIYVTFQTSAIDVLEANLRLPSGNRVTLIAPPSQGNNPIYRSKDGAIELVTHGGGGSIDLIYAGKKSKYEAVRAESEVVTPT